MTEKEALKLALEALKQIDAAMPFPVAKLAIMEAEKALAQPEQEPKVWGLPNANGDILDVISPEEHERLEGGYTVALYTTPPHRTWVGLTDEEQKTIADLASANDWHDFDVMDATEAKLKEKNGC